MRRYFEFASGSAVSGATLAAAAVLVAFVFPAVPIGGETLDTRAGYGSRKPSP